VPGAYGIRWFGVMVRGVVFDLDGTLTDSIEAYYEAFREATARCGIQIKKEEVLESMAMGHLIWDRAISKEVTNREEKIKQCMKIMPEVFLSAIERVKPFPGVDTLLETLRCRKVRIGIVTSSSRDALQPLHNHRLLDCFDATVTREDGLRIKPSGDGIVECLRRMQVRAGHAVMVGDSALDIRAGKEANTLTIGVLSGIGTLSQMEEAAPTAIVEGVKDLLTLWHLGEERNGV
jgi:HAD superfamily hydrolase (TIGR01509 family)